MTLNQALGWSPQINCFPGNTELSGSSENSAYGKDEGHDFRIVAALGDIGPSRGEKKPMASHEICSPFISFVSLEYKLPTG
jgi:hypothetical protein